MSILFCAKEEKYQVQIFEWNISSVSIQEAATNSLLNAFPMSVVLHTLNIKTINLTTEIKCGDKEGYCHKLPEWTMKPESLLYTSLSYSELHCIIEVFKMSIWKGFRRIHKIQMDPSLE